MFLLVPGGVAVISEDQLGADAGDLAGRGGGLRMAEVAEELHGAFRRPGEGAVQFLSDLCHTQAAAAAGEVTRICAELVFGYNCHPSWNEEGQRSCFLTSELEELEETIPGISAMAMDVLAADGSRIRTKAGAERDLTKLKLLAYLSTRIGEEMEAVVTGVESYGLFVQGVQLPAEGLVRVETLRDDRYFFDRASHTLAGHRAGNELSPRRSVPSPSPASIWNAAKSTSAWWRRRKAGRRYPRRAQRAREKDKKRSAGRRNAKKRK